LLFSVLVLTAAISDEGEITFLLRIYCSEVAGSDSLFNSLHSTSLSFTFFFIAFHPSSSLSRKRGHGGHPSKAKMGQELLRNHYLSKYIIGRLEISSTSSDWPAAAPTEASVSQIMEGAAQRF
jgi:hypothetical protein